MPHMRRYLELGGLLGSIYVIQTFDTVFVMTAGAPGTANLPFTVYETLYSAQNYGLASAQGVVVVIFSIAIATFLCVPYPPCSRSPDDQHTRPRPQQDRRSAKEVQRTRPQPRLTTRQCHRCIAAWAIGILFVFPVVFMVLTSLHSEVNASTNLPSFFAPLTLDGYREFFGASSERQPLAAVDQLSDRIDHLNDPCDLAGDPCGVRALGQADQEVDGCDVLLPVHQDAARCRLAAALHFRQISRPAGQHQLPVDPVYGHEPANSGLDDAIIPPTSWSSCSKQRRLTAPG